jgi:hypothetical protein
MMVPWLEGRRSCTAGRWGSHSGITPSRTTLFHRSHASCRSGAGGCGISNKSLLGRGSAVVWPRTSRIKSGSPRADDSASWDRKSTMRMSTASSLGGGSPREIEMPCASAALVMWVAVSAFAKRVQFLQSLHVFRMLSFQLLTRCIHPSARYCICWCCRLTRRLWCLLRRS